MAAEHTTRPESSDSARLDSDIDSGVVREKARRDMASVLHAVEGVPVRSALRTFGDLRGMIDAAEARRLAAVVTANGDTKDASRKAGSDQRVSKRSARAAGRRAKAVKKNPKLGDKLADGSLSGEQLDTIADAMDTDEAAATDEALIDKIAGASADQGRQHGRDWAAKRASADKTQSEHDRQRTARRAARWRDPRTGLSALKLEGDDTTINELWQLIEAEERRLYVADGGRDVPLSKHPRTRDQRRFDAAVAVLLGEHADAGTDTNPNGCASGASGGLRNAAGRPAAVLDIDVASLEPDADRCAELVGYGPIADSVAAELLARSDLFANLHFQGRTLWFGRTKRSAPRDLFIALVVRDRGCVRCGADWQKCQAHHLMPWHAPGKGETNPDNMALLCSDCHTQLHRHNLTLYPGLDHNWHTRPATPNETPPDGRRTKERRRDRAATGSGDGGDRPRSGRQPRGSAPSDPGGSAATEPLASDSPPLFTHASGARGSQSERHRSPKRPSTGNSDDDPASH